MFAPSDQMASALVLIDISTVYSDRRPVHVPEDGDEAPAPHVSRASRFGAAARTSIVRLIPGHGRPPFEPAAR
jgi:hypothetical protein